MGAPLCFVLMPFGDEKDAAGRTVQFDRIFAEIMQPAIEAAGMVPIQSSRGLTHDDFVLADFAIADLTAAGADAFYAIGMREALQPRSTVVTFAGKARPFQAALRSLQYDLDTNGLPSGGTAASAALRDLLGEVRKDRAADSPIVELLRPFPPPVEHLKTNILQDLADTTQRERDIRAATSAGELKAVESNLGALELVETIVLVKLLLAYRDFKAWKAMIDLVAAMPKPLARTPMVREQLTLALNRAGRSEEAERTVTALIDERGGSSETYAILGRVYKDRWQKADKGIALRELDRAIDAYLKGFEADWRDGLPGINAVTLMELRNPPDPRRLEILPIVRYAASRRIAGGTPDYWDYATLLELAILAKNEADASENLAKALPMIRAKWEPETTLNNLRMIRKAREERSEPEPPWIADVMGALQAAAQ